MIITYRLVKKGNIKQGILLNVRKFIMISSLINPMVIVRKITKIIHMNTNKYKINRKKIKHKTLKKTSKSNLARKLYPLLPRPLTSMRT